MTTIEEDYISFETAKLLKEKGFDEATNRYYNAQYDQIRTVSDTFLWHWNNEEFMKRVLMDGAIAIPTLQMTMKWLREVHNIYYDVQLLLGDKAEKYGDLQLGVYQLSISGAYKWECWLYADTYEELYEKYIKYCLENLI